MQSISLPSKPPSSPHPVLNLGFRIFFSMGAIFAMITMALWSMVFTGHTDINVALLNPFYWHGHEMLYGYTMAIIAGFLLTAVKTWTGVMMPYGYRLLVIFMAWALARLCWIGYGLGLFASQPLIPISAGMILDLLFMGLMAYYIFRAVLQVKQYKQMGILAKLTLLTLGNLLFYLGIIMQNMAVTRIGLYLGFFIIIALVLTIGRRVIPFFIERGLSVDGYDDVVVRNSKVQDVASLVLFLGFMLFDMFYPNPYLITITALGVAIVNIIRLVGWYHRGIWKKPLLWSLYLAFLGMCLSMVLYALQPWFHFSPTLPMHGLALAGIGMMTISMMSRVSLGHTGRSIHHPPKTVYAIFILMSLVFIFRVLLPMIDISHYMVWIMMAQTAWILSFALFCISYLPILFKNRPDGLFG